MRRAVGRLLDLLPFDRQSRRALDEALRDWAHEHAGADTTFRRGLVCARSLLGVARTIVSTMAREVTRIPAGWLTARLLLAMIPPVLVLATLGWGHMLPRIPLPWALRFEMAGFVLPQAALAVLPLALLLVVAWPHRDRTVPALGLAATALLGALAIGAWILPIANRAFHVAAYASSSNIDRATAARTLLPAPPDLPSFELVSRAIERPAGPPMGVLLFRTGLAVMAAAFVLLGSALARRPQAVRRLRITAVALVYGLGLALLPAQWELGGHAPAVVGLIPWAAAIGALMSSISRPHEHQPDWRL